jgi:hypothetical protein
MAVNWKENYQRYKNLFWKNYEYYRKREDIRNYVELILNLVAISVFSLFAIKPTAITIIDLNKQIKAKEETIQKMNTKIKNLQQAQNFIDQERSSIDLLDKAIPKEPQAEEFIHSLGGIATLNNLTIKNIGTESITILGTPQEVNKSDLNLPEGTNMVTFSASFTGKFTDLDEFIKKLENFLRPVEFKQLSINKPQEKEGEKTEDLTLGITIDAPYYQLIKTQSQPKVTNQSQTKKEEIIPEK